MAHTRKRRRTTRRHTRRRHKRRMTMRRRRTGKARTTKAKKTRRLKRLVVKHRPVNLVPKLPDRSHFFVDTIYDGYFTWSPIADPALIAYGSNGDGFVLNCLSATNVFGPANGTSTDGIPNVIGAGYPYTTTWYNPRSAESGDVLGSTLGLSANMNEMFLRYSRGYCSHGSVTYEYVNESNGASLSANVFPSIRVAVCMFSPDFPLVSLGATSFGHFIYPVPAGVATANESDRNSMAHLEDEANVRTAVIGPPQSGHERARIFYPFNFDKVLQPGWQYSSSYWTTTTQNTTPSTTYTTPVYSQLPNILCQFQCDIPTGSSITPIYNIRSKIKVRQYWTMWDKQPQYQVA